MNENVEARIRPLVSRRLPFFERDTPLSIVPREWVQHVEHKIARWRNFEVKGDCWFWMGARDYAGEPTRNLHKRDKGIHSTERLKLFVMRIFFNIDRIKNPSATQLCGNKSCLNPRHLKICSREYHFRPHAEADFKACITASTEEITTHKLTGEVLW